MSIVPVTNTHIDVRPHRRPWWHVGHGRVPRNPFTTLGLDWCAHCRTEVDTDTACHYRHAVFTYARWCRRCGRVIAYGVYPNVPMLSDTSLPAKALMWLTRPRDARR